MIDDTGIPEASEIFFNTSSSFFGILKQVVFSMRLGMASFVVAILMSVNFITLP